MKGLRTASIYLTVRLMTATAAAQEAPEQPSNEPNSPPQAEGIPGETAGERPDTQPPPTAPLGTAQDAGADTSPPVSDEAAANEAEIAAELAALEDNWVESPPSATPTVGQNAMNPQMSANALVLVGGASQDPRRPGDLETGIHVQEVEVRFGSNVDPYFRADLSLAASEDEIGFEEAYLSTLEIPYLTIRAGQIIANVGKHNLLHTHAMPFLAAPHVSRALLGEEGLRDPGISFDLLVPLPFFVELNAQVFRGDWKPFGSGLEPYDFVYVGHLKTLFEFGQDTTFEVGGSYARGRNEFGGRTDIAGSDVTLKWRPVAAERYTGFDWSSEYLLVQRQGALADERRGGAFSGLRFQFDQRWWVQARGGVLGLPEDDSPRSYRAEGLIAFIPSEFSGLRLQYAYESAEEDAFPPVHEVFLQALFSIGPHPPHAY